MPKTIATTPSWYWPDGLPRVLGIPPLPLVRLSVDRQAERAPSRPALVCADRTITAGELATGVAAVAAALGPGGAGSGAVAVCAGPSADGIVSVLGALASRRRVLLVDPGSKAVTDALAATPVAVTLADEDGAAVLGGAGVPTTGLDTLESAPTAGEGPPGEGHAGGGLTAPSVCLSGGSGPLWHSQRSLLAGALALRAFLAPVAGSSWLEMASPCSWDGLCAVLTALLAGVTVVAARPGVEAEEAFERHQPAWTSSSLDLARASWAGGGRKRRRQVGTGRCVLVTVDGPFDPDECRALAGATGADVLTMFGTAETGPVLASHPSWHLDESVGIPVPNMHIVPADPDTGEPVDVLWELLDRAMVSVWSPSLALEGFVPGPGTPAGGRFVTGVLAASDPNGMLYLVDEW